MSINLGNSEKLKLSVSIYEVTTLTTVITEDWINFLKLNLIINKIVKRNILGRAQNYRDTITNKRSLCMNC